MLTITTLFLFMIFVAAEFYRLKRRITGSIREICLLEGDPTGLAGARLHVVTPDNSEVTAFVSGCQMCVCRLQIGETVSLVPGPNGYIMKSRWIPGRRHGICPKGMAL
jgi:hypothetical protein